MKNLLKSLTVFHSGNKNTHIFYLNNNILSSDEIDESYSWIQVYISNKEMNIHYLTTNSNYRGNGFATFLILYVINFFPNVIQIELDDFSNNFQMKNNIYTNIGFKYIENDHPEMIGYSKNIKKHTQIFKEKYKNNINYINI